MVFLALLLEKLLFRLYDNVVMNADSGRDLSVQLNGNNTATYQDVVIRGANRTALSVASGGRARANFNHVSSVISETGFSFGQNNVVGRYNDMYTYGSRYTGIWFGSHDDVDTVLFTNAWIEASPISLLVDDNIIACNNCLYDEDRVALFSSSAIRPQGIDRYATLGLIAVDSTGKGLSDVRIVVTNRLNDVLYDNTTNVNGVGTDVLLHLSRQYKKDIRDSLEHETYSPFLITASYGKRRLRKVVSPEIYTQCILDFGSDQVTSVPSDIPAEHLSSFTVIPHPVYRGAPIHFSLPEYANGSLAIELYTIHGELAWSTQMSIDREQGVSESLPESLPPGAYILQLRSATALSPSQLIIVE